MQQQYWWSFVFFNKGIAANMIKPSPTVRNRTLLLLITTAGSMWIATRDG